MFVGWAKAPPETVSIAEASRPIFTADFMDFPHSLSLRLSGRMAVCSRSLRRPPWVEPLGASELSL
jgi:hypothetical protein